MQLELERLWNVTALPAPFAKLTTRAAIAILGVGVWFASQSLLGSRGFPEGIGDGVHLFLAPITQWLGDHDQAANLLLILTSAVIDLLGCFVLLSGIIGPSVRPLLGLIILFLLRQICQALIALPLPDGMIWRYPGFPSLFVTYNTANDFFFSGHTAIAVYGAIELARLRRRWLTLSAILVAAIEALTVLALRAHYTMDVFAAIFAAAWASDIAARLAPSCEEMLSRFWEPRADLKENNKGQKKLLT